MVKLATNYIRTIEKYKYIINIEAIKESIILRKKSKIIFIVILTLLIMQPTITLCQQKESNYTENPPTLDGRTDEGEWDSATRITLRPKIWVKGTPPIGYLMIQNDAEFLYILIDVTSDTSLNTYYGEGADIAYLVFDVDQNGVITDNVDLMFTPNLQEPESGIEKETLLFKYKFPLPSDISQHIPTDSKYAVGFNPSINSETQHVIWEMAISLNEPRFSKDMDILDCSIL